MVLVKYGVVFPQLDIGTDLGEIRAYASAVEGMGFGHLVAYDHVLGADPSKHPGWRGFYDSRDQFHEPFVLFGFMAGICSLELGTAILVLPQRQTALVAKQAAELDILTGGRFRLGVGIGWNEVEYQALSVPFADRGRRIEEQVELLRRFWTEESLSYSGRYHSVTGAGMAPAPLQRPIPIWMGANVASPALERVGRMADGWFCIAKPGPHLHASVDAVHRGAVSIGRDPREIEIEGRVDVGDGNLERIAMECKAWQEIGASRISLNTMRAGLPDIAAHVNALERALDVIRG